MPTHDQDKCRSLDIDYQGRVHSGHVRLQKWKLWLSIIGSILAILAMLGSVTVWGGNQIWQTKDEAKSDREKVSEQIGEVKESVDTLTQQITRLQSQIATSNREFSTFIRETRRQRLETEITSVEAEIDRYDARIQEEGQDVGSLSRQRLQDLRSKRERLRRELSQFYTGTQDFPGIGESR